MLDASCQTTSKTGTQPHSLEDRLPKVILSSQTPQNTSLDAAPCPSEGQGPAPPTRTQAPVHPTRKITQATGPISLTGGRHQKQEEIWPCSQWKGDPKHSKLNKMSRQWNMMQMKKQGKTHKTEKWRGNRQSTWKRIQSNDSKDDQKSWK